MGYARKPKSPEYHLLKWTILFSLIMLFIIFACAFRLITAVPALSASEAAWTPPGAAQPVAAAPEAPVEPVAAAPEAPVEPVAAPLRNLVVDLPPPAVAPAAAAPAAAVGPLRRVYRSDPKHTTPNRQVTEAEVRAVIKFGRNNGGAGFTDYRNHPSPLNNNKKIFNGLGPYWEAAFGAVPGYKGIFRVIVNKRYEQVGVLVHNNGLSNNFYKAIPAFEY
jgi:hypothetical protein